MVNLQGNYSLIHAGHNDMFEFETFDTVHCGQPALSLLLRSLKIRVS